MKNEQLIQIIVFMVVTNDVDVMPLLILLHWLQTQLSGLYQVPGGDSADLDREGCCWKIQRLSVRYATQGESSIHSQKFSATT